MTKMLKAYTADEMYARLFKQAESQGNAQQAVKRAAAALGSMLEMGETITLSWSKGSQGGYSNGELKVEFGEVDKPETKTDE